MPRVHVARHWDGRKPGDEFDFDAHETTINVLEREGVLRRVDDEREPARKPGPPPAEKQTYPGPAAGSSEGK